MSTREYVFDTSEEKLKYSPITKNIIATRDAIAADRGIQIFFIIIFLIEINPKTRAATQKINDKIKNVRVSMLLEDIAEVSDSISEEPIINE